MYIISRIINCLKSNFICFISIIHALWLIFFTFIWLNQSFTYGDELFMMQAISGIKNQIFNIGQKPDPKNFLFVNIAYDRKLIPKFDEDGIEIGRQDITNRENLAKFFHILNQKPDNHKFVLCDVYFGDPCPDDETFADELKQMKNILIPYHKTTEGQWELPIPIFDGVPRGIADYITADTKGTFLKFTFMESDIHKSIPLLMYEKLHGASFRKEAFLYFMNGSLSLNSVILNLRIQNDDLHENEDYRRFYVNMEMLLRLPEAALLEFVKDRIVVIGDFEERDIHETVFGNMAGPLVLVNAYLSLVNGDNMFSLSFLMTLFLFYLWISYRIFSDRPFGIWNYLKKPFFKLTATVEHILLLKNVGAYLKKKNTRVLISSIVAAVGFCLFLYFYFDIPLNLSFIPLYLIIAWIIEIEFITMLTNYFIIAVIFSVFSYFVFQFSVNILFIAAYLTMTEKVVNYVRQKRTEQIFP